MCACLNAIAGVLTGRARIFQELGGNATLLFYGSEEGSEGRKAFMEGRAPDFSKFKRLP